MEPEHGTLLWNLNMKLNMKLNMELYYGTRVLNPYASLRSATPLRAYIGLGNFTYIVYVMCILKTYSFAYTRIGLIVTYITYAYMLFLTVFSYILSFIILITLFIIV